MGRNRKAFQSGVFYHGTPVEFLPGDIISSPKDRGVKNPRPDNSYYKPNRVYITPHYDIALGFANEGSVYEVKPLGPKMNDEESTRRYGAPKGTSVHVRSAEVVRKVVPGESVKRARRNYTTGETETFEGKA